MRRRDGVGRTICREGRGRGGAACRQLQCRGGRGHLLSGGGGAAPGEGPGRGRGVAAEEAPRVRSPAAEPVSGEQVPALRARRGRGRREGAGREGGGCGARRGHGCRAGPGPAPAAGRHGEARLEAAALRLSDGRHARCPPRGWRNAAQPAPLRRAFSSGRVLIVLFWESSLVLGWVLSVSLLREVSALGSSAAFQHGVSVPLLPAVPKLVPAPACGPSPSPAR